jgi:hypothetical protein
VNPIQVWDRIDQCVSFQEAAGTPLSVAISTVRLVPVKSTEDLIVVEIDSVIA